MAAAAVAGFDDIPTLRDHDPALTTVELPLHSMGRQAIEIALSADTREPSITRVAGRVVVRASTGPTVARKRVTDGAAGGRPDHAVP